MIDLLNKALHLEDGLGASGNTMSQDPSAFPDRLRCFGILKDLLADRFLYQCCMFVAAYKIGIRYLKM